MQIRTLDGAKESIHSLQKILSQLQKADFRIKTTPGLVKISEKLGLQIPDTLNFLVKYEADVIVIDFRDPFPTARFLFFSPEVEFLEISTSNISIGLKRFPDVSIKVNS